MVPGIKTDLSHQEGQKQLYPVRKLPPRDKIGSYLPSPLRGTKGKGLNDKKAVSVEAGIVLAAGNPVFKYYQPPAGWDGHVDRVVEVPEDEEVEMLTL